MLGSISFDMDQILDRLSLTIGHRLPVPLNWLVSLVWWITFAVAMLSLWSEVYRALGRVLETNGVPISLPDTLVIVPVMIGLTIVQLVHELAIKRRDILLST